MHRRPTVRLDEAFRHVREGPTDAIPGEDGRRAGRVLDGPQEADEPGPCRRRLEAVALEERDVVPEARLDLPGIGSTPDLATDRERA